jgi:hypothetical protein
MAPALAGPSVVGVLPNTPDGRFPMSERPMTIRLATPEDAGALVRLAALDSARPLAGTVLLAESEGVPAAALSLESGSVTADPFQHTADAVRLLVLRRYQLMRQGSDVGRVRPLLRRLVPSPAR